MRGAFPFASLLYSLSTTEEDFLSAEAAKKDKSGQSSNTAAKANAKKKAEKKFCDR